MFFNTIQVINIGLETRKYRYRTLPIDAGKLSNTYSLLIETYLNMCSQETDVQQTSFVSDALGIFIDMVQYIFCEKNTNKNKVVDIISKKLL